MTLCFPEPSHGPLSVHQPPTSLPRRMPVCSHSGSPKPSLLGLLWLLFSLGRPESLRPAQRFPPACPSQGRVWLSLSLVALCLLFTDLWEVPFEEILDLQWVGSGAQGAVFLGRFHGEEVAVKKVRDLKETDIKHLRKLKHPNIITFK